MERVQTPRIGFIGIGNMGWFMASRLVRGGLQTAVYDSRLERVSEFVRDIGGFAAPSLAALASESDILVTMLPDSRIVEKVLFGPGDCLGDSLRSGAVVIEMSSGAPAKTIAFAERLAGLNVKLIDAPVSGGVQRAETGELAIMVGGDDAVVSKCETVLELMGTSILRIGDVGSGQAMKALNNLVSAGGFLIAAEALLIGRKFGLDPSVMVDVLNVSSGMNNTTQKKMKQFVLSRSFGSGFGLDLMVKDLSIALDIARDNKAAAPFGAHCREVWASAAQILGPGEDHTAITKLCELLAGASLVSSE